MIILWSAIAALSLVWFAGDALLGLLVAPQLFHHAVEQGVGKPFAGLVFGELLGRWEMIAGLSCVIPMVCMLAAVAGRRLKLAGWRTAVFPLAAALLVLGMHATSATVVKQGLATAAELRAKPDVAREEAFRTSYHARSRIVFSAEMLLALAVSVGSILAASRCARRNPA